ncbi:MAG TPA: PDZ domain-containing protein [Gemmatimonadales bacterium]|nr:PDZ domain-containing protein [Gemmatimonadales bacterium]
MRNRVWLGMLAAGAVAPQEHLLAQEPPRTEELRLEHGPDRLMRIVMDRRARLGIKVNLQARETDSIGAYVEGVTPNGPAAKAGIRTGDVITKLDGRSVLAGGSAEDRDARQSLPGLRLIELAARLEPGDTVPVEYRRGTDRRTTSVVTEDEPEFAFDGGPGVRPFRMRVFGPGGPGEVRVPAGDFIERFDPPLAYREFLSGSPLARLELAPLNPDLGQYFGSDEGVLVISVPADGGLGLKGGDVILAVDGRKPAGPSHLLRILRSYESGESFKLDILRNRKRETVTARLGKKEADR